MILTAPILSAALNVQERRAALWVDHLNETIERFDIPSLLHIAAFLAQVGHESARLLVTEENLNYSANGLRSVFPKYFTPEQANEYARKPKAIANRVYANRMGNGSEASGDGWKFRGKGLIQITGKDNHTRCGEALGIDLVNQPDLLLQPLYAALSAGWFWQSNGLNKYAANIETLTKKINGGLNGLEDRKALFASSCKALGVT